MRSGHPTRLAAPLRKQCGGMALPSAPSTRDSAGHQAWPPGRRGTGLGVGAALSAALPRPCDAAGRPPRASPSSAVRSPSGPYSWKRRRQGQLHGGNQDKTQEDAARPGGLVVGEQRPGEATPEVAFVAGGRPRPWEGWVASPPVPGGPEGLTALPTDRGAGGAWGRGFGNSPTTHQHQGSHEEETPDLPTKGLRVLSPVQLPGWLSSGCTVSLMPRPQAVRGCRPCPPGREGPRASPLLTIPSLHGIWHTQLVSHNNLLGDSSAGKTELRPLVWNHRKLHIVNTIYRVNQHLQSMVYTEGTE